MSRRKKKGSRKIPRVMARHSPVLELKDVVSIKATERDWPLVTGYFAKGGAPPKGWEEEQLSGPETTTNYLRRSFSYEDPRCQESLEIRESLLRFPSAPFYAINRNREYKRKLDRISFHTLRLLERGDVKLKDRRIDRVYLLHNGLNENDSHEFYYKIAYEVLRNDKHAACLLRPFPGHLSRHPFPRHFSEQPLDTYLDDPGNLFRQFLRYMIETQWLLSIIAPIENYHVVEGHDLLLPEARFDSERLAQRIVEDCQSLWDASEQESGAPGLGLKASEVRGVIESLRGLIGWDASNSGYKSGSTPASGDQLRPYVHVVGYSLGGAVAQSVFFTWPFAISSCATICSGGAVRDIALTAFAHPEEWQTVVNGIPFEMESAMLGEPGRLRLDPRAQRIAGVEIDCFRYFYRIFKEVFLQDSRGAYQSRVSEYLPRLLFIVGGDDPIVSIGSLLSTSPEEGLTIHQIGNLTHFPRDEHPGWQEFWLPEELRTTANFAVNSERRLFDALSQHWCTKNRSGWRKKLSSEDLKQLSPRWRPPEIDPHTGNEALTVDNYHQQLDQILDTLASEEGRLFLLRNDMPVAFLKGRLRLRNAMGIHHSDPKIRACAQALETRGKKLLRQATRITLVVPRTLIENYERGFLPEGPLLPSTMNAISSPNPSEKEIQGVWTGLKETELELWDFDPNREPSALLDAGTVQTSLPLDGDPSNAALEEAWGREYERGDRRLINTLPDIWLYMNGDLMGHLVDRLNASGRPSPDVSPGGQVRFWADKLRGWNPKDDTYEDTALNSQLTIQALLDTQALQIVKVSGARYNPRFMGWRIRNRSRAAWLVRHAAWSFVYSTRVPR